jgi:hypothetical protein
MLITVFSNLSSAASVQSSSPDSDVDIVTKLAKIDKPETVTTQKTDKPVAGRNRKLKESTSDLEETKTDMLDVAVESSNEAQSLETTDQKIDRKEVEFEFTKVDTEKADSEVRSEEEMLVDNEETVIEEEPKMAVSESQNIADSQKISTEAVDTSATKSKPVGESELNVSNEIVDQIVADIVNGIKIVEKDVAMGDKKVEETVDKISSVDDIEITDKDVCEEEGPVKGDSEAVEEVRDVPVAISDEREDTTTEPQQSVIDKVRDEDLKIQVSSEENKETGKQHLTGSTFLLIKVELCILRVFHIKLEFSLKFNI